MTSADYYDQHAAAFVAQTREADMSAHYSRFLDFIPKGGVILDAGSGSGRDTAWFLQQGYRVEAFDASAAMVEATREHAGITPRQMRFEDFAWDHGFDGIWACASLLHVNRELLPGVLTRLLTHLHPQGVIYCSFKRGSEERRVEGRYFNDMDRPGLEAIARSVRARLLTVWDTQDVRPGRSEEGWLNAVICRG